MKRMALMAAAAIIVLVAAVPARSEIDWERLNTFTTQSDPIDIAHSQDGKWIFILTSKARVLVYSTAGELQGSVPVGATVNGLALSPRGDFLFLIDRANRKVEELSIGFVVKIDTAGAPFMGPADAAVSVVVFSDFQ